jgi:hypothetical protein
MVMSVSGPLEPGSSEPGTRLLEVTLEDLSGPAAVVEAGRVDVCIAETRSTSFYHTAPTLS